MFQNLKIILRYVGLETVVFFTALMHISLGLGILIQEHLSTVLTLRDRANGVVIAQIDPNFWGIAFIVIGIILLFGALRDRRGRSTSLIIGSILTAGIYTGRLTALQLAVGFSPTLPTYFLMILIALWIIWRVALITPH